MARYIDADRLIERLKVSPIFQDFNTDGYFIRDMVIDLVECQQIADVVPSAEVERLQHILDCYALQYGTVKDQQSAIDKAKAEVEKEIGEEIYRIIGDGDNETWICLLIRKLADKLTKKDESQN